jgi:hypothetical protein
LHEVLTTEEVEELNTSEHDGTIPTGSDEAA